MSVRESDSGGMKGPTIIVCRLTETRGNWTTQVLVRKYDYWSREIGVVCMYLEDVCPLTDPFHKRGKDETRV